MALSSSHFVVGRSATGISMTSQTDAIATATNRYIDSHFRPMSPQFLLPLRSNTIVLVFENSTPVAIESSQLSRELIQSRRNRLMMDGTFFFFFFFDAKRGKVDEPPNRPWQSHVFQGRWVPVHPLVARYAPRRPRPIVEPSPGNGPTMKDQLGVMQYQPLAVGRDNGVTALRHDTPISVSQAEDEVMVGLANVSGGHGNTA